MISSLIDKFFCMVYHNNKSGHIAMYSTDTLLIKEGHIPLVAYRLLEGEIEVYKKSHLIGRFQPHTCWGMNEIMNERKAEFTVIIKKGSRVCTLGKSDLQKTWMKIIHLFEIDMLEEIEKTPDFNR
jgi:CRP-like cAMP-binding protein